MEVVSADDDQRRAEPRIVLAGGMIFDGSGLPLFAGDVLVVGNRIEAVVAASESWSPPEHAVRIELDGRTVMPGLVEGHAHISFTNVANLMELALMPVEENLIAAICNAALLLDHGFTSLVSAAAAKPRLDVVVRNAIEAGQIVGPRMLAASQEITPTGNLGDLDQAHLPIPESARFACICDGPDAFRLAARRFAREGVDILKVNVSGDRDWGHMGADANATLIDDDELAALVKVAHGRGRRVAGHATSAGSVKMWVRHGVDIIYHAAFADAEALDMVESVKDSVFVAPAVGFPYAYLHEGEKYGSISRPSVAAAWRKSSRSPLETCRSFIDEAYASFPAATTGWCARRRAATRETSNCSSPCSGSRPPSRSSPPPATAGR